MQTIEFGGRRIGTAQPCFLIAEAGVNHNGNADLAHQLVDLAADMGADAVKFQSFDPDRLAARGAPKAAYQQRATSHGESQYEMLRALALRTEAYPSLMSHAEERGLAFLSSPFDEESASMLDDLGVKAFKIPSGELVNHPYLRFIAGLGKPLIVSTGMATLGEVERALETIEQNGNPPVVLLHCVSSYPAAAEDANLRAMKTLRTAFGVPVGYSDHTRGIEVSLAAVALGACVLEKHVTLDTALPGPDHAASLGPPEAYALGKAIRLVESALGDGRKRPRPSESEVAAVARKSLVLRRDLRPGELIEADSLIALRPGTGIPPSRLGEVVGRRVREAVEAGSILRLDMLQ